MEIVSSDFSVIIQGPILGNRDAPYEEQLTMQCIESIRNVLPEAEVIISTWNGSDVSHLTFDKVVFNEDPGAVSYNDTILKNTFNNNNRQIVTTHTGLMAATRKYSIKMRGDCKLLNSSFINFLGKYDDAWGEKLFSQRVVVPIYFSRNPAKVPLLYHISDLFQIGLTSDLLDLWSIPLQPEPETTRANTSVALTDPFAFNEYKMRYASEQYIWYAFTHKKNIDLSLKYYCQTPIFKLRDALLSIINNFVIVHPEQLGLELPKRLLHGEQFLYTFDEWLFYYEKFCKEKSFYHLLIKILLVKKCAYRYFLKNGFKRIKKSLRGR